VRSQEAIPAIGWLRTYRRTWLRADVVGGITAGLVVVPQAMAYATIADLPVQVGLYTCMVPMAVYALVGGSRVLSVSTTSTIATLTASTLVAAGVAAESANTDEALDSLATLVLLTGVVLLLARLFRLGPLIDNISEAIITGLKVGVGLTVAAGQLPKLLGIAPDPDADTFVEELPYALRHLGDANGATVLLSIGTIALLLAFARWAPTVPAPLIAVVGGILLVALFGLDDEGVSLIAAVPQGLPVPDLPAFDHVGALLPGAIAIALMAYMETVSVGRAVRRPTDPPIDNNQELIANGAASVAGAFFGSMPPAGGFSQTAVNQRAGSQTQVSGLVTVGLAVAAALFLGAPLDDLPEATLGAMVFVAVLGLIRPSELAFLARFDRLELFVALLTAAVGLTAGLLVAVAVGVAANLLLVLRELNHPDVDELRLASDGSLVPAADLAPTPGLLVLRIGAPLYTANAREAQRQILERVDAADPRPHVVVVDATAVGRLSVTLLQVFRDLDQELRDRGVELWIASLPPRALEQARMSPGWDTIDRAGRLHPTTRAALDAFAARA
jgi:high affinity sulfate transporter 1